MKNWLAITITLLVTCGWQAAQAAGDPVAGKEKSSQCAACHGVDGNSINPEWPKLAGQHADYLVKQLSYFEAGERENVTMKPMASVLDEKGREDVAAYYASQKVKIGAADDTDHEFFTLGERIYRAGNPVSGVAPCMGCHGPNGGQHAKYIENQLHGFAEGKRVNENAKKMMQILASRMTNKEIRAVANYIQGLH